jgi:hypothetical protein
MSFKCTVFFIFLLAEFSNSKPTESREWVSTAGTKVTGAAHSVKSGKVLLKLADGRELTVPLDKLSAGDREFLTDHFGEESDHGVSTGSGTDFVTEGLVQKIGEVVGPIDSGGGSRYFLYIPKSLRKDRLAPLMHVNDAGGGNANSVKGFIEGAEICGWVLAASVESKNGNSTGQNFQFAKANVAHITGSLPVDPQRIYFTGGSGGGAMSFYNAAMLPGAGSMPQIGYIPDNAVPKKGDHFVCGGTTDYNRYTSANAVEVIGKSAIHRLYVAGHGGAPPWLRTEGIVWLNGRYLAKSRRSGELAAECLDYEASMIEWIGKLSSTEAHRAYYWCVFLRDEYKISGANAALLGAITAKLSSTPGNVRYVKGIEEISKFSEKHYAKVGSGSQFKHTTPQITKESEKLAAEFAGVPMIEEIMQQLGMPTVGR